MIKILYFAHLREQLETGSEELSVEPDVGSLVARLRSRGGRWEELFGGGQMVMIAVNQEMANAATPLAEGDEVAFFPPVTGG